MADKFPQEVYITIGENFMNEKERILLVERKIEDCVDEMGAPEMVGIYQLVQVVHVKAKIEIVEAPIKKKEKKKK